MEGRKQEVKSERLSTLAGVKYRDMMGYNTGERTSELVIGAFEIQDEVELIRIIHKVNI